MSFTEGLTHSAPFLKEVQKGKTYMELSQSRTTYLNRPRSKRKYLKRFSTSAPMCGRSGVEQQQVVGEWLRCLPLILCLGGSSVCHVNQSSIVREYGVDASRVGE